MEFLAEALLRKNGEVKKGEGEKMESLEDGKIYHNCCFRSRNGTNKLIGERKNSIFGGTDKLYYKGVKWIIPRYPILTRRKLKNWKTENE